jgi:hypothetical protein
VPRIPAFVRAKQAQVQRALRPAQVEARERLRALAALTARAEPRMAAGDDLTRYEASVFSQNGEDGILTELFARIGVTNRFFVEFGIQTGHEGNCVLLADVFGWDGLFMEADPVAYAALERKYRYTDVSTRHELVTPENIESILAAAGVPDEPDLVSIDIDGADLWVWNRIRTFRPRVVVIEYNGSLPLDSALVQPVAHQWDGSSAFGASLGALERVAAARGYELVHTDLTGVNAFFVRSDLRGLARVAKPPRRAANYFLRGGSHAAPRESPSWVDLDADPALIA